MSRQLCGKFVLQGKKARNTSQRKTFEKSPLQRNSFEKSPSHLFQSSSDLSAEIDDLYHERSVNEIIKPSSHAQHVEFDYEANVPSRSFESAEDFTLRGRTGSSTSTSYSIRRTIMQKRESRVSPETCSHKAFLQEVRDPPSLAPPIGHMKNAPPKTANDSIKAELHLQRTKKRPKYVIDPQGKFRSLWDTYLCILLVYVAVFVPYRISYLTELTGSLKAIDYFVDMSFGVDIILNFFTAYEVSDGTEVWDLKKIGLRYLKGYFFLDIIASFPFDLIISETIAASEYTSLNQASKLTRLPKLIKILRVMRLLKLLRMYRITKFVRDIELNYNVHQGISRLLHIWLVVMLVTHFVGCLWHAAGTQLDIKKSTDNCIVEEYSENSTRESLDSGWICREGLIEAGTFHKYVSSLYWAFSTLTTVGYGDISAKTIPEQLFSMIMMMLGVSWYAYIVGSMTMIVSSFDRVTKQNRGKMMEVNTFIREAKLSKELAKRIRKYFEYSLSKKKSAIFNKAFGYNADELLVELSSTLRNDVITYVERDLIEKIPFFRDKSITFVANTVQLLQPIVVQSGDYIIKESSTADEIYFLINGRAVVCIEEKAVTTLSNGDYFGEIGCIMGGVRKAGVKASTICELQCLSKRNLNLLLGEHPRIAMELKRVARARTNQLKVVMDGIEDTKSYRGERSPKIHPDRGIKIFNNNDNSDPEKSLQRKTSDDNVRQKMLKSEKQSEERHCVITSVNASSPVPSLEYITDEDRKLLENELASIVEKRVERILDGINLETFMIKAPVKKLLTDKIPIQS